MMGSRSNDGADALAGLLALVSDPKKTAAKLTELQAAITELAQARQLLHADQARLAETKRQVEAQVRDVMVSGVKLTEERAALAAEAERISQANAAFTEREAGFVARDKERDDKARVERQAIRVEMAELKDEREMIAGLRAAYETERDERAAERAALDEARAALDAEREAFATKQAALAAIMNGGV